MKDGSGGIILFDGVCNLCNAVVAFVIHRDRRGVFRFAALQSVAAQRLLAEHGEPSVSAATLSAPQESVDDGQAWQSVIVIADGRVFRRSAAVLHILRRLGPPWSFAAIFLIVPAPLRDWLYAFVARHRYRWFGKRDTCMIPTPDQRARFLD